MSITEESRHLLFQALEAALGRAQAVTLMEHLPPVGWADVATKRDLDHLETTLRTEMRADRAELRADLADLRADLAETRADLINAMRVQSLGIIAANAALVTLAVGLTQLF